MIAKVSIWCLLLAVKTLAVTSLSDDDDLTMIRQELHQLQNTVGQLQAIVEEQNKVNAEQSEINIRQEADINHQRDQISKQGEIMNQQRNEIIQQISSLCSSSDFVGFSAYATEHQDVNIGDTIQFPGIETNAGGDYGSGTSIFTCPQSGYYYIYYTVHLRLHGGDNCYVSIKKDGVTMVSGGEYIVDTDHANVMTSQSVLLECDAGSQIWIEADETDDCYVWGESTFKYSTFGGFLLREL